MTSTTPTPSVFDVNSLVSLKAKAKDGDPQALKATAKQFEALFLQMVMKSMRDATPRQGMFDSDQSRMYESLLDSQLAQNMADRGSTGLAAMIERQFARKASVVASDEPQSMPLSPASTSLPLNSSKPLLLKETGSKNNGFIPLPGAIPLQRGANGTSGVNGATVSEPASVVGQGENKAAVTAPPRAEPEASLGVEAKLSQAYQAGSKAEVFAARMRPYAEAAEKTTGIPANFMIAQAALETGWGRAEPRNADGSTSYNLFGIKAGRNWKGATTEASTVEYANGQPQRQVERFRSYSSYAEAFRDYANLLTTSPRYSNALNSRDGVQFARALQDAGYATDPQYASKLERIMGSSALRG